MLSTTAIKKRKAATEKIQSDELTKVAKKEANNPLVSKQEASSVTSSAEVLAADIDRLAEAIYRTAAYHHVQARDLLNELQRRIA